MKFSSDQVGSNLMFAITSGLYSRSLSCIREYIQNAYDPPASAINVRIYNENGTNWVIENDGEGMNEMELARAIDVGRYTKTIEKSEGRFGIGIWSGISVCNKMVILTKKKNSKQMFRIEIGAKEIREKSIGNIPLLEFLSQNTGEIEKLDAAEEQYDKSFTIIRLEDTTPGGIGLFTEESLIKYVSENIPVRVDTQFVYAKEIEQTYENVSYRLINVKVNDKEVYRLCGVKGNLSKRYPIEFKDNEKSIAKGWYCLNKDGDTLKGNRGISVRHNGFLVMDWARVKALIQGRFNDRFIGEIYVNNTEPMLMPVASRDNFQQNDVSSKLEGELRSLLKDLQRVNSFVTVNISSPERKIRETEKVELSPREKAGVVANIQKKNFKEDISFLDKDKNFSELKKDLIDSQSNAQRKFVDFKNIVDQEIRNSKPTRVDTKEFISSFTDNPDLQGKLKTMMLGRHKKELAIDLFNPLKKKIQEKVSSVHKQNFSDFSEAYNEIGRTLTLFEGSNDEKKNNEHVHFLFKASYKLFRNLPLHAGESPSNRWFLESNNQENIKNGIMALITLLDNMINEMKLIKDPRDGKKKDLK